MMEPLSRIYETPQPSGSVLVLIWDKLESIKAFSMVCAASSSIALLTALLPLLAPPVSALTFKPLINQVALAQLVLGVSSAWMWMEKEGSHPMAAAIRRNHLHA